MSPTFPYTYISCPCSDPSRRTKPTYRDWRDSGATTEDDDDDERTFDPRHPRASYSLYPPEHLLYCEECHDIKCPRCVTEEIVCWYCPSCLFETPSSMVRSEGNRCARNCFNCPVCTAPVMVQAIGDGSTKDGPWVLNCNYCMWSSLDIGIKFDKPTNIRSQLDKIVNGRASKPDGAELARKSSLSRGAAAQAEGNEPSSTEELNHVARFAALKSFLKNQLATSMGSDSSTGYDTYASPSALTRIMSLYTTSGSSLRKPKSKPPLMREALTPTEGLQTGYSPNAASSTEPPPSVASDFSSTPSPDQLLAQYSATAFGNPAAKSVSSLRPMPTLLRTKRSKRCKSCKHILVKPEFKPQSTRFRIRLIALAYIPLITLRPLQPPAIPQHPLTMEAPILTPGKTSQFILNLKNHLFEPVKVTLGVPGTTPGKYGHRVTVLCPQFEIGANSEVWDDALAAPTSTSSGIAAGIGAAGEGSLMGGSGSGTMEAGKVFERGRNWVGVGVEIICAPIITVKPPPPSTPSTQQPAANATEEERPEEDPDLLEIPIRVRLEWRQTDEDPTTTTGSGGAESNRRRAGSLAAAKKKPNDGDSTATPAMGEGDEDPAKRELAYWMVVGVGRVARFL